jgi:hypothetical protein
LIDEDFLLDCWRRIRKNAACGVDGISARQYEENLMGNIRDLVERLKRKNYRARLVRRHWIPKTDGKKRPLGIPVVEDKLLQLAVTRILESIYEQDFLRCSYGYRPKKGALDAVLQGPRHLASRLLRRLVRRRHMQRPCQARARQPVRGVVRQTRPQRGRRFVESAADHQRRRPSAPRLCLCAVLCRRGYHRGKDLRRFIRPSTLQHTSCVTHMQRYTCSTDARNSFQ